MSYTSTYQVIGTRPIRHDGTDKVTGRAQYGADVQLAGLLHGRILRSPHAHALIHSIDVRKARNLPGVEAVVTAADLLDPGNRIAELGEGAIRLRDLSCNTLAREKVLYKGHAVAAVAAGNPHVAEEALDLIEVEYEPLAPVLEVRAAMEAGAPILHPDLRTESLAGPEANGTATRTNIAKHLQFKMGDPQRAFADAAVVIERSFQTAMVHQGYIEPHSATALWNADDTITVWCSTQGAFTVRAQLAELLQLPLSRIKVIPMEIGSGFGGKIRVYLEPVAALLSRGAGRPVKVLMSGTEGFEGTGPTPGSFIRVKLGADKDGRLLAGQAMLAYEAGAYPGSPVGPGAMCIFACYDIPNVVIDGYDVVVNKPATSAYRAPGATNAAFAAETVVDEVCERLALDPLEFRIRNGAREGTRRADGSVFPRVGMIETVRAAQEHPHYRAPLEGWHRGRGVASGFWFNCGLKSGASASINDDGTVGLVEGSTDLRRQLCARAAQIWEVPTEAVKYDNGTLTCTTDPAKHFTFKELAAILHQTGGTIVGRASVDPQGQGGAFATHIVDVEVDADTGKVTILRYTAAQDCGTAIHPAYVKGQMQGGAVQGIGWALNEEYFYNDKGVMMNASFLDYRMTTSLDLPMIDTLLVEVPDPNHPFGVRGVGEVPIVPPPAALANAIYRAVGVRMQELPMSPPRVLKEMLTSKR